MAKDSSGRKFNRIPEHTRIVDGKIITVKPHVRSNRNDSKGKKKITASNCIRQSISVEK